MLDKFLCDLVDDDSPISRAIERWFWPVYMVVLILFVIAVVTGLANGTNI